MGETDRANQTVRFGVFEVDLRSGELRKSGARIRLQEQPFKVLTALLERPGEVVTREELRQRIWPQEDFGDFDHAVNIAVAKLRAALGDSAEAPHLVETLHRRGYRFISPIAPSGPKEQTTPATVLTSAGHGERASESGADITSGKKATATDAATSARSRWPWISAALFLVLALGGAFAWFGRPLLPPRVLTTTQLTHDGFIKTSGVTDGSWLYMTETTGSKQFLVQSSAAGSDSSVIPTSFANIQISAISPDHSQLLVADAVGNETEGQLWVLPLPAGAPRRVGDVVVHWSLGAPGWAVWSPDGHQIVFARASELYVANADGSNVRGLVAISGSATEMQFSRDGTHLRFTLHSPHRESLSIWEVRADGTDLHPLFPDQHGHASEIAGDWSADGRYYFFTSCDDSNRCSIWAIREATGFFHRQPSPPVQLTNGPMPVFFCGNSADGRKIFGGGWSGRSELVRYDSRSHQFTPFLGGISAGELDFSRDGKWVAYVSDGALWRSRADGSERLQLTSPPISPFLPRWSPDGKQIAYVDEQAGPLWQIFLISAEGGAPRAMLSDTHAQLDPSWSADGKQLAFGRVPWQRTSTETIAIQIVDLTSKQVSTIPGSENLFAPRWSPDGRRLAALSMDGEKLLLFDFKTKKWRDWIHEPGVVSYPSWSRDGTYLYYDNTSTKTPGYRRVKVGQSRPEFLFDLKDLHRGVSPPVALLGPWSGLAPDGFALFEREIGTDEIYSLEVELP